MEPKKTTDLNKLQPYVKNRAELLIEKCKEAGLTVKVIETLRTPDRQTWLNKQNPTNPPLLGPHGYGLAFDAVPVQADGSINWDDHLSFQKMGKIGISLGLAWGGNWTKVDGPHFEYRRGLTDAQIRAGQRPVFPPIPPAQVPLDKQFRVYGTKLAGNGLTENYAKTKSVEIKKDYDHVYYLTPDGRKVEVK